MKKITSDETKAAAQPDGLAAVAAQPESDAPNSERCQPDSPAAPSPVIAEAAAQTIEHTGKTVEQLQEQLDAANAKNAEANATITELSKKREEADAFELAVREKMQAGLTREQAGAVIRRQHEWDRSDLGRMQNARHARRQAGN